MSENIKVYTVIEDRIVSDDYVLCFQPRKIDPPHYVAENYADLHDIDGDDIGGDQCDNCGSFGPDGEPMGYTVRASQRTVECQGCGRQIPIVRRRISEVIF